MIRREIWVLIAAAAVLLACSEKKGPVETAACGCAHLGDLNGDGVFDIEDVLRAVRIVNQDSTDVKDRDCPHVGRADVNCDCVVDSFDVLYLIGFILRNEQAPCNPCDSGMGCPRSTAASSPLSLLNEEQDGGPYATDAKGLKPLARVSGRVGHRGPPGSVTRFERPGGGRFLLPPSGSALTSCLMIETAGVVRVEDKGLRAPWLGNGR